MVGLASRSGVHGAVPAYLKSNDVCIQGLELLDDFLQLVASLDVPLDHLEAGILKRGPGVTSIVADDVARIWGIHRVKDR